jgi:dTDP-4-dehydrorhamnose reductase
MKGPIGSSTLDRGPVLILGASGFLGSNIFGTLSNHLETYGTFFKSPSMRDSRMLELDATDLQKLSQLVKTLRPSRIINCLGLTNVEECEERPEASWKLNTELPILLSRLSMEVSAQFVQISTDHFYSDVDTPRSETAVMTAINQYGYTKLLAEKIVLLENPNALILRTNFFGYSQRLDKSILNFAINSFYANQQINGFEDVLFTPVGIHDISNFLTSKLSEHVSGLLNFASENQISKYDFLILVGQIMGFSGSNVRKSSILDSNLTVRRPGYLALDPSRLINDLGYSVPSLRTMLENEIANQQ